MQDALLSADQSWLLKCLLQSRNPDNLVQANKIIKEDERKMDALTGRYTELVIVNNNSRFFAKLLDHYDATSSGPEEGELVKEPFNSCIKMLPKLVWLASETEEGVLSNC